MTCESAQLNSGMNPNDLFILFTDDTSVTDDRKCLMIGVQDSEDPTEIAYFEPHNPEHVKIIHRMLDDAIARHVAKGA